MSDVRVGYVSLKLALNDGKYFSELLSDTVLSGRIIAAHDMHLTLMYDQSNPIPANAISKVSMPDTIHDAVVTGVGVLGEDGSKYRAIVLHLESPSIDQRFDELSIFMTHSFDSLKKHVSLVYGATDEDFETVIGLLTETIGKHILLYGESFATIKED